MNQYSDEPYDGRYVLIPGWTWWVAEDHYSGIGYRAVRRYYWYITTYNDISITYHSWKALRWQNPST